jgi:hypothetical protein
MHYSCLTSFCDLFTDSPSYMRFQICFVPSNSLRNNLWRITSYIHLSSLKKFGESVVCNSSHIALLIVPRCKRCVLKYCVFNCNTFN